LSLQELLAKHRSAIVEDWFQVLVDSYPAETGRFLRQRQDRFANPVGATLGEETERIFDFLAAGETDSPEVREALDRILRIRAVQSFSPAQALGFLLELKRVVRRRLGREAAQAGLAEELAALEDRADRLLLAGADVYCACREQVQELKVNEMRKLYSKVLERSGVFAPQPGPETQAEPDLK
jgi:hypothetical protein